MASSHELPGEAGFEIVVHRGIGAMPAAWPSSRSAGGARFHVFQSREFLLNWAATVGTAPDAGDLLLVEAFRAGRPVLALPLTIRRSGFARVLSFADGGVADYNAPVLFPVDFAWTGDRPAALWAALRSALPPFDIVEFTKMPAEIGGLVNPLALVTETADAESCHGNDLTRGWDAVLATQSQLKTTRRYIRRLEEMGDLRFEIAATAAKRRSFLDAALAQKQHRFEETHVATFHEKPWLRRYFEHGTEAFAEAGMLLFAALTLDRRPIATSWNLVQGNHVYGILVAFEPGELARYAPGRILNLRLLEHLHERGFAYYDQGIGDEAYKVAHCDATVALARHVVPVSAAGQARLALAAGREALRNTPLWQNARRVKWEALRRVRRHVPAPAPAPAGTAPAGAAPPAPLPAE